MEILVNALPLFKGAILEVKYLELVDSTYLLKQKFCYLLHNLRSNKRFCTLDSVMRFFTNHVIDLFVTFHTNLLAKRLKSKADSKKAKVSNQG